jgi:hypothetical protein
MGAVTAVLIGVNVYDHIAINEVDYLDFLAVGHLRFRLTFCPYGVIEVVYIVEITQN